MDANENVATAVKALQIHQLKKAVNRAKAGEDLTAADMRLIDRIETEQPPAANPDNKKKRGRPMKAETLARKVEERVLEDLLSRQERGEKLTGADYAFLEKMKQEAANAKKASNILQLPVQKQSIVQRLKRLEERAVEIIELALEREKGVALATFVKMALDRGATCIAAENEKLKIRFTSSGDQKQEQSA